MKFNKSLLAGAVATAAITAGTFAPVANAEVSASVGVASTYLWRGFDLGTGVPAVSGSLDYAESGFYAGIWGSSGDTSAGTEYDLYAGYGAEFGDFFFDVSVVNYLYPTGAFAEEESFGDFVEGIVSIGYGPVSFTYYDNLVGAEEGEEGRYAAVEDYYYYSLAVEFGAFSAAYGKHEEGFDNDSHLDLSYAYNDNLAFTVSIPVDNDADEDTREPFFVVSYSMPIE